MSGEDRPLSTTTDYDEIDVEGEGFSREEVERLRAAGQDV